MCGLKDVPTADSYSSVFRSRRACASKSALRRVGALSSAATSFMSEKPPRTVKRPAAETPQIQLSAKTLMQNQTAFFMACHCALLYVRRCPLPPAPRPSLLEKRRRACEEVLYCFAKVVSRRNQHKKRADGHTLGTCIHKHTSMSTCTHANMQSACAHKNIQACMHIDMCVSHTSHLAWPTLDGQH